MFSHIATKLEIHQKTEGKNVPLPGNFYTVKEFVVKEETGLFTFSVEALALHLIGQNISLILLKGST